MVSSPLLRWCFASGFFGATAGVLGKVTFESAEVTAARCSYVIPDSDLCAEGAPILTGLRLLGLTLLILSNLLALHAFNGALRAAKASLEASAVATAANLVFTAAYGRALFGETLALSWWAGAALIALGVALLGQEDKEKEE